ncbi:hypothetical protein BCR44DRAFT_1224988 [Catenaria anguillulae PL171]|uniref:Uncharacterized protein n=1 Tax=Catenaria anguillulae PL171 TaxID=765915 RepID=A0A1Y2HE36_9FUNG|nr:hypothetical protein BCR44DRAFT_1224988 [Catenaria anguillulae PL171]
MGRRLAGNDHLFSRCCMLLAHTQTYHKTSLNCNSSASSLRAPSPIPSPRPRSRNTAGVGYNGRPGGTVSPTAGPITVTAAATKRTMTTTIITLSSCPPTATSGWTWTSRSRRRVRCQATTTPFRHLDSLRWHAFIAALVVLVVLAAAMLVFAARWSLSAVGAVSRVWWWRWWRAWFSCGRAGMLRCGSPVPHCPTTNYQFNCSTQWRRRSGGPAACRFPFFLSSPPLSTLFFFLFVCWCRPRISPYFLFSLFPFSSRRDLFLPYLWAGS